QQNRALHLYDNLRFYHSENDAVLFYGKATRARDNIVFVAVTLDPFRPRNSFVHVPVELFTDEENASYQVHDLLDDARYTWRGRRNYVELHPERRPAHIFRLRRLD